MAKFDQYEIADIKGGKDITRAWVGALSQLLQTQDPLLLLKSGGDLSLYEATAQDDQVLACMQQRIAALVSREVEVVPGGEKRADVKAADWLQAQVKTLDWDDVVAKMAWGVFYGYSVAECVPVRQGDAVGLAAIKVRNRRRFRFDADLRPRLITPTTWNTGVELEVGRFWHFSVGSDHHDEPYGRGLAWWLYWLCYFKRNDLRFWMTFLETFAKPKPRGKYDSAATAAEQQTLWEALAAYADDTRIMHPVGMEIDLLEPSRSGSADYQAMYEQLDRAIAKVIRSQTMTTEDGSSRAQAQVHQGVADDVDEGDAGLICGSFNRQVVPWLFGLNPQFAGAALPQVWMRRRQEADLKGQAERDKILFDMGFVPSQQYVQDAYGDGFAPPSADQPTPLNGAQLKSIIDLVTQVQQGALQPEVGAELLKLAVPTLTDDLAARIAQPPQEAEEGGGQEQDAEVDLDQVAASFAAAKKCSKGLSCGSSCISKTKTCRKPLTPAQVVQHAALTGRVVAGTQQDITAPPVVPPRASDDLLDGLLNDPFDGLLDGLSDGLLDGLSDESGRPPTGFVDDLPNYDETPSSGSEVPPPPRNDPGSVSPDLDSVSRSSQAIRAARARARRDRDADYEPVSPRPTSGPSARRFPQPIDDKDIPEFKDAEDFEESFEVDGNRVAFYARTDETYYLGGKPIKVATIGFSVNGSYIISAANPLPADVGRQIQAGLKALQAKYVASCEDGVIFSTSAMTGDGKGVQRVKAYQMEGFSDPIKDLVDGGRGDAGDLQVGFVKGGKLIPFTTAQWLSKDPLDEYTYLENQS